MTRIWRAGDEPLPQGTRVRALKVPSVPDAVGEEGIVARGFKLAENGGMAVDFGEFIRCETGEVNSTWWFVSECEVIDDGGER